MELQFIIWGRVCEVEAVEKTGDQSQAHVRPTRVG
jgi:hypothetical protein